jgi:hypothetical protein
MPAGESSEGGKQEAASNGDSGACTTFRIGVEGALTQWHRYL